MHVVVVDLHSPGVRLEYIIAHGIDNAGKLDECRDVNRSTKDLPTPRGPGCDDPNNRNYYPIISLEKAVQLARERDGNTAAVINSDYGAGSQGDARVNRDHGPEGLTIVRGDRLDGPANGDYDAPGTNPNTNNAVQRPWLVVSESAPLQAKLDQYAPGTDHGGKPADWVYTGVGGAPWLIREGDIQEEDIASCRGAPGSCYIGAHQSAVGLSKDGRWMFLVVDVRAGQLIDLAHFIAGRLDTWNAIKFDGGGSSQLWYGDETITAGDGRRLSQYLAVIAQPGSGIEITPPEESPPTDRWEAWKQKIQRAIEQKFEEWRRRAEDEFDRRWEEFQAWLLEFLQRELERLVQQWLDQVCGSSALLLGSVLLIALRRRRR